MMSIDQMKALPTSACSCDHCKKMCMVSRPCWGLPEEITILLDMGYASKLMEDYFESTKDQFSVRMIVPALVGHEGQGAPWWPMGQCCLLDHTGACTIHVMKPIEGRVCNHENKSWYGEFHVSIAKAWDTPEGKAVVRRWREEVTV